MLNRAELCDLIVEGLPVALFVVDGDYRIMEFNDAAEAITGWKSSEVLGRHCAEVFASNLCEGHCPLQESAETGQPCLGRRASVRPRDGRDLPILFSSRAILNDSGEMICGIEVFRDATEVENLEMHKRNLISLFAHDLKSPVAITGGFVDRLLDGKAGELNEKQRRYLGTIKKEIQRLEQYIFSFLDIARIESGQLQLEIAPSDIDRLVSEIVTAFTVQAAEKNIHLQLEKEGSLGAMDIDRLQISRVVSNLLDNAIKYSPPDSRVDIRLARRDDEVVLEIHDQGPGISPRDQAHIFNHFYRINDNRRNVQGSGLGLAAVKAIVEAHGGRVWLESSPDRGSSFYVALPVNRRS